MHVIIPLFPPVNGDVDSNVMLSLGLSVSSMKQLQQIVRYRFINITYALICPWFVFASRSCQKSSLCVNCRSPPWYTPRTSTRQATSRSPKRTVCSRLQPKNCATAASRCCGRRTACKGPTVPSSTLRLAFRTMTAATTRLRATLTRLSTQAQL